MFESSNLFAVWISHRLELKADQEMPEDWTPPEISDDILSSSAIHNYKKDKDRGKGPASKGESDGRRRLGGDHCGMASRKGRSGSS